MEKDLEVPRKTGVVEEVWGLDRGDEEKGGGASDVCDEGTVTPTFHGGSRA